MLARWRVPPFSVLFLVFLIGTTFALSLLLSAYLGKQPLKSSQANYSTIEIRRTRALNHQLHQIEYQTAHIESELTELRLRQKNLFRLPEDDKMDALNQQLSLVAQHGPGFEITVKDSEKPLLLGDNPNTGLIHNTDLVLLVNDLWAAGAKAVSINDQTLTTNTAIRCAGLVITIDGKRVTSPFVIKALGDPTALKHAMKQPGGYIETLKKYGIEVTTAKHENIVIAPALEPLAPGKLL